MTEDAHILEIRCNKEARDNLVPLLWTIKYLCNAGSSRRVTVDDHGTYFIDGDGPDGIASITVDGSPIGDVLEEKDMPDFYDQLIKLGAKRKDLRPHIRPVLDEIKRQKEALMMYDPAEVLYEFVTAGGRNTNREALDYLKEGPRKNIRIMEREMDVSPQIIKALKDDWDSWAKQVRKDLLHDRARAAKRVSRHKKAAGETLFETLYEFCNELARVSQKILRRESSVVSHRVSDGDYHCEVTHKATRTKHRITFGLDAADLDNVKVVVDYMRGGEVLDRDELPGDLEPTDVAEQAADRLLNLMA